jgi:phosphoenolpyruvate carboxykinase (ATP)
VPDNLLDPSCNWADCDEFDRQARALATRFKDNFVQFEGTVSPEVVASGPVV